MGLFSPSPSAASQPVALKGIRVQTSAYGVARPMVYGTTRATVNLLWYGDFIAKAIPAESGGK